MFQRGVMCLACVAVVVAAGSTSMASEDPGADDAPQDVNAVRYFCGSKPREGLCAMRYGGRGPRKWISEKEVQKLVETKRWPVSVKPLSPASFGMCCRGTVFYITKPDQVPKEESQVIPEGDEEMHAEYEELLEKVKDFHEGFGEVVLK